MVSTASLETKIQGEGAIQLTEFLFEEYLKGATRDTIEPDT